MISDYHSPIGATLRTDLTEPFTFHVIFSDVVLQFILLYHLDTLGTFHKLPVGMMDFHVPVAGLVRSDFFHTEN